MKRDLYIFDLDGTLADCQHRIHFLNKKDWRSFFAACVDDKPIEPVIAIASALYWTGAEVWVFSGRSDEVRQQTLDWLYEYTPLSNGSRGTFWDEATQSYITHCPENEVSLTMRREGDFRADDVVKQEMLDNMLPEDRERLVAVFDDRDRVVDMWRRNGIQCFQVAPGDF